MRNDTEALIHSWIIAALVILSIDYFVDQQVINWLPDALFAFVFGYINYAVWAMRTDKGRRPGIFVRTWVRLGS